MIDGAKAVFAQPRLLESSVLVGLHDPIMRLPRVHVLVRHRLHHRIGARGALHREVSPELQSQALIESWCKHIQYLWMRQTM